MKKKNKINLLKKYCLCSKINIIVFKIILAYHLDFGLNEMEWDGIEWNGMKVN